MNQDVRSSRKETRTCRTCLLNDWRRWSTSRRRRRSSRTSRAARSARANGRSYQSACRSGDGRIGADRHAAHELGELAPALVADGVIDRGRGLASSARGQVSPSMAAGRGRGAVRCRRHDGRPLHRRRQRAADRTSGHGVPVRSRHRPPIPRRVSRRSTRRARRRRGRRSLYQSATAFLAQRDTRAARPTRRPACARGWPRSTARDR